MSKTFGHHEPSWAALRLTSDAENVRSKEQVQTGSTHTGQVPIMDLTRVVVVD
jgi:hypothetical protein